MAISSRVVKITAKATLKNNYVRSLFSCGILLFCVFLGIYLTGYLGIVGGDVFSVILLALFNLFLTLPLGFGVLRFFWRMLFSVQDNPVSVFYYFSSSKLYCRCLKLCFKLMIKAFVPALIFSIPVVSLWLVSKGMLFEMMNLSIPLWTANLSYIYAFIKVLAIILFIIYMFKYYLAPLFFIADENMDLDEAIHISTVISKKSSLDFSYLVFSFMGWIVCSIFVLPLIFIMPYFFSSYTVHFRYTVAEYNKHVEENNINVFPEFSEGG